MRRLFQKSAANDTYTGLSVDDSRIALASVRLLSDAKPRVTATALDVLADETDWAQQFRARLDGFDDPKSPITSVLPHGSYQLLLIEVPEVPADEVIAAVRWQIKDLLDFPVDEAVVELFDMPGQSNAGDKKMAYAVATQRGNVQEHIELVRDAGFSLNVINIPELCTRNIATRLPQDADGVALLHLTEDHGLLTVSRQGILYLVRRIDMGRKLLRSTPTDDFAHTEIVSGMVLEIQRSLDYYESHFDRRPLQELVLAPGSDIGGLGNSLKEQLGLTVSHLDLGQLFEMQGADSPEEQGDCLLAIGAALRSAA